MIDRIRLLERRDVDELIILDIAATPDERGPRFEEVKSLCENLFMPVTIGGGVRTLSDIRSLLAGGADKVAINTATDLVSEASRKFGAQAIVVSIDVRGGTVHTHCGRHDTGRNPVAYAVDMAQRGAGEILLTSIERDGTLQGYDVELIRNVSAAVDIPVIACGGAGTYAHMHEILSTTKAHAVAAGAMFQFCEATPKGAARHLHDEGHQVRL